MLTTSGQTIPESQALSKYVVGYELMSEEQVADEVIHVLPPQALNAPRGPYSARRAAIRVSSRRASTLVSTGAIMYSSAPACPPFAR